MKHSKKILCLLLALVLTLGLLAGCASDTTATEPSIDPTQSSTEIPTTENPTELPSENTETPVDTETPTAPQATEAPTDPPVSHTHSWNAATCTAPKTCACGATEGSANGHSWNAATCTAPKTCKTCGATEGNAKGHSWNAATCTVPKTCKTCGATEGGTGAHNYVSGACSVCGAADPSVPSVPFVGSSWKLDALSGTQLNRISLSCDQGTGWFSVAFWSEYGTGTPFQFGGKTYYSDSFGKSADLTYAENGDTVTLNVSAYGGMNVGTLTLKRESSTQYKVTAVSGIIISDSITSAISVGSLFTAS